jgi:hypothetical protein
MIEIPGGVATHTDALDHRAGAKVLARGEGDDLGQSQQPETVGQDSPTASDAYPLPQYA